MPELCRFCKAADLTECWGITQAKYMVKEGHLSELDPETKEGLVESGAIDPLFESECPFHEKIKETFVEP